MYYNMTYTEISIENKARQSYTISKIGNVSIDHQANVINYSMGNLSVCIQTKHILPRHQMHKMLAVKQKITTYRKKDV